MRLFIAEKPSVARAIADELGVTAKEEGYIICGQDKITWCFGHLLELAEPDRYLSEDIPKSSKTGKNYGEQKISRLSLSNGSLSPKRIPKNS